MASRIATWKSALVGSAWKRTAVALSAAENWRRLKRMVLKLPRDFAKKIGEVLGLSEEGVGNFFEIEEDKMGFFVARLKQPKQFLEKDKFRTMCALARDLGGEGYIEGAKAWKVKGPYANSKSPSGQGMGSEPAYKAPGNAIPTATSSPETDFLASHKAPGSALPAEPSGKVVFAMLPVKALLSTPFQSRDDPDDPELTDLAESLKAYGVLEPIVVRQKPNGLHEILIEIQDEVYAMVKEHGDFRSLHEGYAVILEELEELWDEVKRPPEKRDLQRLRAEALNVAASAAKFALFVERGLESSS